MSDLSIRYRRLLTSPNPIERALAKAQLAALERANRPGPSALDAPLNGQLARRIEAVVGPLHHRANGNFEGGCPWHSSKSGTCLVLYDEGRRWFCRSCRRGGDVVIWIALIEGISVREARERLGVRPPRHLVVVDRRPLRLTGGRHA